MLEKDISLRSYNTFGIEARARYFAAFRTEAQLLELLAWDKNISRLILGGGSNILLTKDFDGLVLRNELKGIEVVREDDTYIYVRAGAGESWHGLVMFCVGRNYAGMENLALIPGNVGASPMQNIGAYGVEIKDLFHELEAIDVHDGTKHILSREECAFGYRDSVFKGKYKGRFVITSVTYRLLRQPVFHTSYGAIAQELEQMGVHDLTIQAIAQAVINIRTSKLPDPKVAGNAGSFFKNPVIPNGQLKALLEAHPGLVHFAAGEAQSKLAAGWLIEQCGWKGYREGDAGCYPKQALVLVNYGKATGREIYDLSEKIIASVQDQFGVRLEREVNMI